MLKNKIAGVGLGLRPEHFAVVENTQPDIPWFEILSDNYFVAGGAMLHHLDAIREKYPMTMHSVGMSVGSTDALNTDYLTELKTLADRVQPAVISDHLCWVSAEQEYFHELLPLPYTDEAVTHVADRITQIQDYLGQRIAIENVSSYMNYAQSEMTEWEFITNIANTADCDILLDVNNVYVSAHNHGFDPMTYINALPIERITQCHLAGYKDCGKYLLDDHGSSVQPPVWDLYDAMLARTGPIATLIEWDTSIPTFETLCHEASHAQRRLNNLRNCNVA